MKIVILDKKVDKIINDDKKLVRTIGPLLSKIVIKRINQLSSSNNFYEYKESGIGKPHPLNGDLDNEYSIHLTGNFRIIVKPMTNDLSNNGLKECNKVDIKGVIEYHDGKQEWLIPYFNCSPWRDIKRSNGRK